MSKEVPSINIKDELINSSDIRRQLSQSMGHSSGGVSKPTSRRGSIAPTDNTNNDNDDDDDGNERKRRDNINEKIQELLTLVPLEFFNDNKEAAKSTDELDISIKNSGTKDGKPNKGQILTKSVEYIQYLQNKIDENNRKEVEMLVKLRYLTNGDKNIDHTSAERALGEIGVGPLSQDYFKNVLVSSANANKSRKSSV